MMKYSTSIHRIGLALVGVLTVFGSNAQNTSKFTASKANEYGLVYSLPLTCFDIYVETVHTERTPGEFVNYANRHLGLQDAIREASKTVDVKSITIVPRGVADADNRWLAQFKAGSTVNMTLTASGIPLSINTDKTSDSPAHSIPVAVAAPPTPLETEAARQAITADMTRSTSLSKKAELAAQRIFELREQRNELISGNADNMPPDGSALQVALKGLAEQEAALTAMFAGTTKTYTTVNSFAYTPGRDAVRDTIIARISPAEGVVGSNDLSGIPLTLTYEVLTEGKLPVNEKGIEKKFPKGGVAYNIPGSAKISVSFNGKVIASVDVDVAQLGCVFGLDPAIFSDRRAPMMARFSPVTGAIIELNPAK